MLPVAFTFEMDRAYCHGCETVMEISIKKKDTGEKDDEDGEANGQEA